MLHIDGKHRKTERKSRRADQKIAKGHNDSTFALLPVDPPCDHRSLRGLRINRESNQKLLQERVAKLLDFRRGRAIYTVNDFRKSYSGKSRLLVAHSAFDQFAEPSWRLAATLRGNDDARIDDYSHGS